MTVEWTPFNGCLSGKGEKLKSKYRTMDFFDSVHLAYFSYDKTKRVNGFFKATTTTKVLNGYEGLKQTYLVVYMQCQGC